MANNDVSAYTLRWNEILGDLEYYAGLNWISTGVTAGMGISQLTGDVTAGPGSGSQVATISAGAITNAKVAAAAAIAFSKLAALTSTHILVGNGSNVATDVALSGDATLANTGALTLATVNGNVGSFTSANITVNAKGLITAAANGSGGASPNKTSSISTGGITVATSTYQATGIKTASITPSSSSASILVHISVLTQRNDAGGGQAELSLHRDNTNSAGTNANGTDLMATSLGLGPLINVTGNALYPIEYHFMDTPGDTNPHTYTCTFKSGGTDSWSIGGEGRITAFEIH